MQFRSKFVLFIVLIGVYGTCSAQDYFGEITFRKNLMNKEKWTIHTEGKFKNSFQSPVWSGIALDMVGVFRHKKWKIDGGLLILFVDDTESINFFELRPRVRVAYTIPIKKRFKLLPSARIESRNFLYTTSGIANRSFWRPRLKLELDIDVTKKSNLETRWGTNISYEWYYKTNTRTAERYASSQEMGAELIYYDKANHKFKFGVYYQSVRDNFGSSSNTITNFRLKCYIW
ncbi:MAG: hypothetical protein BM564_08915 [Bacteroidetes bacterium MedPE-SWsnd-G2]|nr:MAG: hypothetical protein BM564_08915 [Bacteroidetes bacterium MedPE-SWsnd-G2]